MRVHTCDHCVVELPARHPFPMGKYRALRLALVAEGVLAEEELCPAPAVHTELVERVHEPGYVRDFLEGTLPPAAVKRSGFPWSASLVRRTLASVGGTLAAARAALADGLAGNLAGGTHHAHHAFGAGYCLFNDIAVTARALLDEGLVGRVLVFDVDVHQGDGTAALFADEPRVFTVSVHGARNFPARKAQSDLDVALADGTGDEAYLEAVSAALERALAAGTPDLALVQAGVDPLEADHLGRLAVSHAGLLERDRRILGELRGRGIPVALTLGGGYSRPIDATIAAHVNTYRAAREVEALSPPPRPGGAGSAAPAGS